MYEVLKIDRCAVTSFLDLKNTETGTVEKNCFDDTRVLGQEDFDFMKEGGVYDCKLMLFGEFVDKDSEYAVPIQILETDARVGDALFLEVSIGDDIYYIPKVKTKGMELQPVMYYDCPRKDLIQVDDVIHPRCL